MSTPHRNPGQSPGAEQLSHLPPEILERALELSAARALLSGLPHKAPREATCTHPETLRGQARLAAQWLEQQLPSAQLGELGGAPWSPEPLLTLGKWARDQHSALMRHTCTQLSPEARAKWHQVMLSGATAELSLWRAMLDPDAERAHIRSALRGALHASLSATTGCPLPEPATDDQVDLGQDTPHAPGAPRLRDLKHPAWKRLRHSMQEWLIAAEELSTPLGWNWNWTPDAELQVTLPGGVTLDVLSESEAWHGRFRAATIQIYPAACEILGLDAEQWLLEVTQILEDEGDIPF